ncbi:hypothetical protein [Dehalogenimonas etheniformans]|uniref:Uncharacterized protein n=1 Tax=Dehalogenimonas etheniformans TaxID=1536648 RepID=A0A2P5P566_9CHLR|nr:hypothetical protein [Dehalogenimonas etheniformans]PPD57442.1 hypothetical protein JP09_008920 [Dehalogenimonas etheniformans]QNT76807.1 hypothetical protein HX448_09020 [Dehalogenimonas etheniformans]
MEKLNRRYLRTTILWIVGILAVLLYAALATVETAENYNNLALVRAGDLIGYSLVALLFALLSFVLKGNNNRTINIVAGAIFTVITLIAFIDSFTVNMSGIYNPVLFAAVLVYGVIFWFALKTPKTL